MDDDLDLDSAKKQKKEVKREIESTKSDIAVLQRKIDRLKKVKKKIAARKSEAKDLSDYASKKGATKKLGLSWEGWNYDVYVDFLDGSVKRSFKNYVEGIDDCLDRVVDKINEYENKILRKETLLSGLWTRFNDLSTWIEKLLN